MPKQIIPVVAGCILKQHPLRILLHQKNEPRNPELVGKWEFPGGMMDYGETPKQTLEREIREELGIIIQVNQLLHAQTCLYTDRVHYLVLFYACQTSYETAPDGCKYFAPESEWVDELDCLPNTHEVIKVIANLFK